MENLYLYSGLVTAVPILESFIDDATTTGEKKGFAISGVTSVIGSTIRRSKSVESARHRGVIHSIHGQVGRKEI